MHRYRLILLMRPVLVKLFVLYSSLSETMGCSDEHNLFLALSLAKHACPEHLW